VAIINSKWEILNKNLKTSEKFLAVQKRKNRIPFTRMNTIHQMQAVGMTSSRHFLSMKRNIRENKKGSIGVMAFRSKMLQEMLKNKTQMVKKMAMPTCRASKTMTDSYRILNNMTTT